MASRPSVWGIIPPLTAAGGSFRAHVTLPSVVPRLCRPPAQAAPTCPYHVAGDAPVASLLNVCPQAAHRRPHGGQQSKRLALVSARNSLIYARNVTCTPDSSGAAVGFPSARDFVGSQRTTLQIPCLFMLLSVQSCQSGSFVHRPPFAARPHESRSQPAALQHEQGDRRRHDRGRSPRRVDRILTLERSPRRWRCFPRRLDRLRIGWASARLYCCVIAHAVPTTDRPHYPGVRRGARRRLEAREPGTFSVRRAGPLAKARGSGSHLKSE